MIRLPGPRKVELPGGSTLLYQRNPVSPTVAFGVWITRGSRDEKDSERGLSHLLEHMVFRGTPRRDALEIALDLEAIGGQWDAFTGREAACYHGKVLAEHFESFAEILADIVLSPLLPAGALAMEKKVVQEEIRSIADSPEESTYELFYSSLFHGDQMGYPIAGRVRDVASCDRARLVRFHRRCYTGPETIFAFIGNLPLRQVRETLERMFSFPPAASKARRRKGVGKGRKRLASLRRPDWSQAHVCAGARTVSVSDPDRYPLIVLSNILGGGISSRLFQSLREREGLAYSVFSHTNFYRDTGVFSSFFSVDPRNLGKAMDIYRRCMDELRSGGVEQGELDSAKSQLKASVVFGIENIDSRLFKLFHSEFYHGRYRPLHVILREIEKVGRRDIERVIGDHLGEDRHTYVTSGRRHLRGLVGP